MRFAAARPRPFVVAVPGGTATRLLAEAELRRRGWHPVSSPVAAGLLVVCGEPGPESAAAVETAWADMPGPRALARLGDAASSEDVAAALSRAARELADVEARTADAVERLRAGPWSPSADDGADMADMMAGGEAEDHDGHHEHHEHHGHGGHGGHEHHMGAPAGLAMAERAEDRDGLKLDVLHVPLGPVLSDWPAGLCVRLTLQGDVVLAAEAVVVGGVADGRSFWDEPWSRAVSGERVSRGEAERRRAAAHLDSVARLLAVAGWRSAADQACRLRDDVLGEVPGADVAVRFARFARRVGRSRTLRWMLRDLGVVDQETVDRHGLTGPAARRPGDVLARLLGWLDEIGRALGRVDEAAPLGDDEGPRGPVGRRPSKALLDVLPGLLEGAELAAARLIVASLDPDLEQLTAVGVSHG